MKLKRISNDKKGAVLEMSIFFMLIVFTFCTLLVTMTLITRSRIKIEKAYFNMDMGTDPNIELIAADCRNYFENILFPSKDNVESVVQNICVSMFDETATPHFQMIFDETGNIPDRYDNYNFENTITFARFENGELLCSVTFVDNSRNFFTVYVKYTVVNGSYEPTSTEIN